MIPAKAANLRRFWAFLRPHWKLGALGGFCMMALVALQLPMPLLTMYLLDHTVPQKDYKELHWIAGGLLLFVLLKVFSNYYQTQLFTTFRNRVVFAIRRRLFSHLESLPIDFFNDSRVGKLAGRVVSDVSQVQGLMASTLLVAVREVLTMLVGVVLLLWLNWQLAAMALGLVPFHAFWMARYNPKVRQLSRQTQESYTNITGDVLETFYGIYLVKSYVAEKVELVKMLRSMRSALRSEYQMQMTSSLLEMGSGFASSMGKLALIWYGCYQIMNGDLTLGQFLAFNSLLKYLFDPTSTLVGLNTGVQQSLAAVERLDQLFEEAPEVSTRRTKRLGPVQGLIEFKDVSFSYDGNTSVLKGINLRIEPGRKVAIVGKSGSGKTTLAKLLMGFHTPRQGSILIDGQDISEVQLSSLRRQIGLVPQDAFLFTGDVWFNLRYGKRNATKEEMIEAAKLAYAHDFILKLPKQYDTEIGERGVRLSGGQRQRLLIALAFLKNAPILILDEATSSVDSTAEHAIQDALTRLMARPTTLIIAHRLSTVREADMIVVLDEGRIVQTGSHDELFAVPGPYRVLYQQYFAQAPEPAPRATG